MTGPEDVEPFVRGHVRSIEELEALLLLYRSRTRWWTAEEVGEALHLAPAAVRPALERLCGAFLEVRIESEVRFRFATLNADRERLTAGLAQAYHRDRSSVLQMLGSPRAARDFADAFRLKEEDEP